MNECICCCVGMREIIIGMKVGMINGFVGVNEIKGKSNNMRLMMGMMWGQCSAIIGNSTSCIGGIHRGFLGQIGIPRAK